jgi:serine/threonine protein kinase
MSGGTFSVGYLVEHENGTKGFMKASDLAFLTSGATDVTQRIQQATTLFNFEVSVLDVCRGSNMDRIVTAIDHGEMKLTHNGTINFVFFLIFERARGDVRDKLNRLKKFDLNWSLHALHNLAVAIQQLHIARIAHNDVKPSNLLEFDDFLQKLADLGRAVRGDGSSPFDKFTIAGDRTYAPPDLQYHRRISGLLDVVPLDVRRVTDLYLLGSMIFFFLTGSMATPIMKENLTDQFHPEQWQGTFEEVLPYWQAAFTVAIEILEENLPKDKNDELTTTGQQLKNAFAELCNPNPLERGHRKSVLSRSRRSYSVERYISLFDRFRRIENR